VLFVHEVHAVVGRDADAFDSLYRDEWVPALADGEGARLLWYLHQAHGTGPAYTVVTITALASAEAWVVLGERLRSGDLGDLAAATDALRYEHAAKVLTPVDWSPLQEVDLASARTSEVSHAPVVFMEDTAHPYRGRLDDYLAKAGNLYVATLERAASTARGILELVGAFVPAFGTGTHREVVLWQRVRQPDALLALLTREVPPEHRAPGTWMHDALDVRDRWDSRLLRTTEWSPLA
jgi:hypothetical protein